MADVNKKIKVLIGPNNLRIGMADVIITNDSIGKTITIGDEYRSFTLAFEEIEKHLK